VGDKLGIAATCWSPGHRWTSTANASVVTEESHGVAWPHAAGQVMVVAAPGDTRWIRV